MRQAEFTSRSRMTEENGTYRFTFFCERCDRGFTTQPIRAQSVKQALSEGRRQARVYFNRCSRCFAWVCDEHYNEDFMMCTACAPRFKEENDGEL